jgi:hypothetical protein
MCPDPALLVAYLDGTLFSRDAVEIDRHTAGCERCAALLASMRYQRAIARVPSRWPSLRVAVAAGVVLAAGGLGAWALLSWPWQEPAGETPTARVAEERPPATGTESPAPLPVPAAPAAEAPAAAPSVSPPPAAAAQPPVPPVAREAGSPLAGTTASPPRDLATPPPDVPADRDPSGGIVLRDRDGRLRWRTSDRVIEHSPDDGATWVAEYTADRPIRAGTLVDAEVAWLVGDDGLVLRRTSNGWFGTNPPADTPVDAVRASSPSRATVTLIDGRVLTTDNGGITWSGPSP